MNQAAAEAVLHRTVVPVEGIGEVAIVTVDAPPYEPSHDQRLEVGGRWSESPMAETVAVWSGGVLHVGGTSQDVDLGIEGNRKWLAMHHANAVTRVPRLVRIYEALRQQGIAKSELVAAVYEQLNEEDGAALCLECGERGDEHWTGQLECDGKFAQYLEMDLEA